MPLRSRAVAALALLLASPATADILKSNATSDAVALAAPEQHSGAEAFAGAIAHGRSAAPAAPPPAKFVKLLHRAPEAHGAGPEGYIAACPAGLRRTTFN